MAASLPVSPSLLARIAANVVAAATPGREVFDVGPFRALITPTTDLIYLNYAVPLFAVDDWETPLDDLKQAFQRRGRRPRLEYLEALWPALGVPLARAGFVEEMAAPLMALEGQAPLTYHPSVAQISFLRPDDPSSVYAAWTQVCADGFGIPLGEAVEESEGRARPGVSRGALLVALATVGGEVVAAGQLSISGDVAELAGVTTLAPWRRRGIGAHLCGALVEEGRARGVDLVWLSAGSEGARVLYDGLGFTRIGDQIHTSVGG